MTTIERSTLPIRPISARKITADEWRRMWEAGVFPEGERLELIEGEIVAKAADGDPHVAAVMAVNEQFVVQLRRRAWVSIQSTMWLSKYSVPEPDVVVVRRSARRAPRPQDALLVVEVSASSLRYDRQRKIPLYARAGIPEAWIVDLKARRIEVYREPSGDTYLSLQTFGPGQTIALLEFPDVVLAVDDILPPQRIKS